MKLVDYVNDFEKGKVSIIKYWLANTEVMNIIKEHEINAESFVKNYAFGVLEYYISVIKDENKIGDCPVIEELLSFLKASKIDASELFLICSGFKNAIIEYAYDLRIVNYPIQVEINRIFEKNFSGVLDNYEKSTTSIKKEYNKQKQILIEQSKAAAMGEMISMIAHQWRQPLQAVSILTQKLTLSRSIDGEISDELLNQVVEDVSSQLKYMSKTIDDFRDFFLPNKQKEEILVSELIQRALDFVGFMIKNDDIKININEIKDDSILIHINEFVQVVINIIKNARDVMIEKSITNKEINISYEVDECEASISIEDSAEGIPEDIKEKIFEPYFSTKSEKNGTGLGLYMSKTIIEKHCDGYLSVENSSKGAVFKIELPLC